MKRIILCLIAAAALTGCGKYEEKSLSLEETARIAAYMADIDDIGFLSLTNEENAAEYGISAQELEEGVALYSLEEGETDMVVLVRAKEHSGLENVERALENKVTTLTLAYKYNREEREKLEKHLLKTRGMYVLLVIGEKPKAAEAVFDKLTG